MTAQILHLERRWNNRKNVENEEVDGRFYLDINSETFELTNVHDLSISGMGLVLPIEMIAQQTVTLRFQSKGFDVSLSGKVMWCEKGKALKGYDMAYRVGVEFDTENHQDLVMYFMAVRKYLDEFNQ